MPSSRSTEKDSTTPFYGILYCTLAIIVASIVIQTRDSPPLNEYISKKISSTKPYATFEEFYPYYLKEHSQPMTRLLHYVGTSLTVLYILLNPFLLLSMFAGGLVAYSLVPFCRHFSNGIPEICAFALVYIIGSKLLTRSFKKAFMPLIFGYGCAWIGHFCVEHNKPATFIYPSFSLMGDFHMMYDAIKERMF